MRRIKDFIPLQTQETLYRVNLANLWNRRIEEVFSIELQSKFAQFYIGIKSPLSSIQNELTNKSTEAATLPLILTTSAISLFRRQSLPPPWSPRTPSAPPLPLIIYGASSALGAFTIKLARASNIHPILAIAGSSTSHITPLLDAEKGDTLFDYNVGAEKMIQEVNGRLRELGLEAKHAVDCISSRAAKTWIPITQMLAPGGVLSVVSGANRYDDAGIKEGVKIIYTYVGTAHSGAYRPGMPKQGDEEEVRGDPEWVWLFWRYASRMLADGRLTGHPYKVVEGGLEGVEKGLNMLKRGEARGVKFVYRLTEEE
jgi:NADPH2:quinone reductase